MPQSHSRVLVHLVFSTKQRVPMLTPEIQRELHPYLAIGLKNIDCPPLKVGGMEDHVHLLFRFSRTLTQAQVVGEVKTASSKWLKKFGGLMAKFHWQSGYGMFSVSHSDSDRVVAYIENQAEHHRHMSFQDEFRKLLEKHGIEYDERYVWD
jgi:REP element-mobilizing transposase RayT